MTFWNESAFTQTSSVQDMPVILKLHQLQSLDTKIVSEYEQEIPQSQTADNPVAPWGRTAQPSRDIRKTS